MNAEKHTNSNYQLISRLFGFLVIAIILSSATIADAQPQYRKALDFDGNGAADIAVKRIQTNGGQQITWFMQTADGSSYSAVGWGIGSVSADTNDIIVPADYDNDSRGDVAVARKEGNYLVWYILNSGDGSYVQIQFGLKSDKPMPGDYDGDGKADIAVARIYSGISTAVFYILQSSNGQAKIISLPWNGDSNSICQPVQGNFDGDGKADPTVYCVEPSNYGYYSSIRSVDGVYTKQQWGIGGDKPVFGDFDGDGRTDLAVIRGFNPSVSSSDVYYWYIKGSMGGYMTVPFGSNNGGGGNTSGGTTPLFPAEAIIKPTSPFMTGTDCITFCKARTIK